MALLDLKRLVPSCADADWSRLDIPSYIDRQKAIGPIWLLHLSNHRQARDEMGKLHWRLTNQFRHHGGAGFHSLGFDPSQDLRQGLMTFMFDDDAKKRSEAAVLQQLPKMIYAANRNGPGLLVEALFAGNCNDTPVTSDIMTRQLLLLRDEGEGNIMGKDGSMKPRSRSVGWDDRLVVPPRNRPCSPASDHKCSPSRGRT